MNSQPIEEPGSFVDRFLQKKRETKSILCVGLDPTIDHVPISMRSGNTREDVRKFCTEVIYIAKEKVPVVKPQFAHWAAMRATDQMIDVISVAKNRGLLTILDAKRGDIGSTMENYGEEVFGHYGADACTFVPYLGATFMAWEKWLAQGRMAISMIRTSNSEADVIQDIALASPFEGLRLFEIMAMLVGQWDYEISQITNGLGRVGGVVGATRPSQAKSCRERAGDNVFFLIPGYGAQGAGADDAVSGLLNGQGIPMGCVNSSRGITLNSWWDKRTQQPRPGDPLELIAAAIDVANAELNEALEKAGFSF